MLSRAETPHSAGKERWDQYQLSPYLWLSSEVQHNTDEVNSEKPTQAIKELAWLRRRAGINTMSLMTCGCHLKFNTTQMRSTCLSH